MRGFRKHRMSLEIEFGCSCSRRCDVLTIVATVPVKATCNPVKAGWWRLREDGRPAILEILPIGWTIDSVHDPISLPYPADAWRRGKPFCAAIVL